MNCYRRNISHIADAASRDGSGHATIKVPARNFALFMGSGLGLGDERSFHSGLRHVCTGFSASPEQDYDHRVSGAYSNQKWAGQMANGARVYDVNAFQAAFLLIAGWSIVSCLLISLTSETYCKPNA